MVSVSFLVLGTDSLEGAPSHLVSLAELICFVQDSFIMPVPRRLLEAWERHVPSEVQMEGGVTPREEGGWQFEDARERRPRARAPPARVAKGRGGPVSEAVQQRVKPPTQAQNIAEIRQLLGERFDEIGRRMTALERFIPASAAGGSAAGDTAILGDPLGALRNAGPSQVGETPGVLGVVAGPIDSAAALRCTCHAGPGYPRKRWSSWARDGRGDTERACWSRRGSAAWIACPTEAAVSSRPAARAATSTRAAIADRNSPFRVGNSAGTARRSTGEPFRTRREPRRVIRARSWWTTKQQLGRSSQAVSMPELQAPVDGILRLERIVATRRAHPEVVVAANDSVTREVLGLLPGESLSVQRHARELLIPQAGNFSTLKRMAIMIAGALDEGRQRGSVHRHGRISRPLRNAGPRVWVAVAGATRSVWSGSAGSGADRVCWTGCLPSRSQCSRCGSSWTRARSRTRNWRERDRGSRGRCWTSSGQGGCQGGSAGRRAGQEAAAGRGKRRWGSWERRGRHHERLRKPRRTAERPDQRVAGPRQRKQLEEASAAACEPLPAWARCEDQPKGWDFVLSKILPSLSERSATMERAAGNGTAKAGPRRRQRAHWRCVREQLRSAAAVALRWLKASGSDERLRDGSTFTLPDRVEELFGSASRT